MANPPIADAPFERSFALFDRDARLVEWDAGFAREFSTASDLIASGARFQDLVTRTHDKDGVTRIDLPEGANLADIWDYERSAEAPDHVFEYRDGAGRTIRVNCNSTASGGSVRTARDVTSWRKTDAASSSADVRWSTDGDPLAQAYIVFVVAPDGTHTYEQPPEEIRAVYGLTDDFPVHDFRALFDRIVQTPAEAEIRTAQTAQLVATLEPQQFDVRIRTSDERLRWLRIASTGVRQADGSTLIRSLVTNVTLEKLAEDQLELLRSAVTHATDAIQIVHTDPSGDTTTVYVNPAFTQITGWSSDDVTGLPLDVMPHWREDYWDPLLTKVKNDDGSRAEIAVVHRNGTPMWLDVSATVLERREDGSIRWVAVSRNIDERRRVQDELRRARDEADEANKSKSEFLANMSHEIRTPMNGIIGMNALLMRTDLNATQQKYAENVRVSADSLLGIINDILDISKLEASKVELDDIDFSLQDVVEDVVELLSTRAQEKSLEIASFLDDGSRAPLRGDPARIRQIMLNLLSNAIKFTERGFVSVEVSSQALSDGRTALRVEVHDTGIGLTAEAKGKLFRKFQQADGSITRRFGGTGLGLSICRQLVELMGGQIGIADRRGGGSIFWFDIELAPGKTEIRKPRHAEHGLPSVRILVVDDIELNRNIFVRQLELEGAILCEAASGPACLEAMQKAEDEGKPFAAVILDHQMPDMAGDEVAARIRAHSSWRQPKLVLASSIGAPLSGDHASKVGFDAFLTKPIRQQALVDCIADLIELDRVDSASAAVPESASAALHRGRILLAEDNEINTLLAATLLEEAGYNVTCVVNGAEAVEAVSDWSYDLVLMDVQMPVMDGLRATREIRALGGEAAKTPIVAMTANAMSSDREDCLAAGMEDFVSKPIVPEQFLRTVEHIVSRTREANGGGEEVVGDEPTAIDVDLEHLDGLARLLPAARFKAMLDAYLLGAEHRMERIESCVQDMDMAAIAREAHDLKSTSGNFGARRLQSLAEQLEAACRDDDVATTASLVVTIRQASTTAWAAIRHHAAIAQGEPTPIEKAS